MAITAQRPSQHDADADADAEVEDGPEPAEGPHQLRGAPSVTQLTSGVDPNAVMVQRRARPHRDHLGGSRLAPELQEKLNGRPGGGEPLPSGLLGEMSSDFGVDFSGVRIHRDAQTAQLSRRLEATAFTRGSDIYFGAGTFRPETAAGRHLIAHELAHVVQQHDGMTSGSAGTLIGRADDPLERQADEHATRALHTRPDQSVAMPGPPASIAGPADVVQRVFSYQDEPCATEADAEEVADHVFEENEAWIKVSKEKFRQAVVALAVHEDDLGELGDLELIEKAQAGLAQAPAKAAIAWWHVGTQARIGPKVAQSLPQGCSEDDLRAAANTRHENNVDGWNLIKKMSTGEYELKIAKSGKMRAYGLPGGDGLLCFSTAFVKGKGK